MARNSSYILNLKNINQKDVDLVGKTALERSLLVRDGFPTPPGFVITSFAFDDFLRGADLVDEFSLILSQVKPFIRDTAVKASEEIKELVLKSEIPKIIQLPLIEAYKHLSPIMEESFVSVEVSSVIDSGFVPGTLFDKRTNVKGIEQFLHAVKLGWISLFTADSIEYRANEYYQGPLTIALIVQKMNSGEVSGTLKFRDQNTLEVNAIYGITDKEFLDGSDKYIVDLKKEGVITKHVTPQRYMNVRKGRVRANEDVFIKVEISEDWRNKQKVSDQKILELGKLASKLKKTANSLIKMTWYIETGNIYIEDFAKIDNNNKIHFKQNNVEANTIREIKIANDRSSTAIQEIKTPIVQLNTTLDSSVQQNILKIENKKSKTDSNPLNKIFKLINPKKDEAEVDQIPRFSEKYEFKKVKTALDISSMSSVKLHSLNFFDYAYFDATTSVVLNKILPEEISSDTKKLDDLIDRLALDISTAARSVNPKELFYSFSSIGEAERELLNIKKGKYQFSGDERFIDHPEAILTEYIAIQRAIEIYKVKNIHLVLPSLRTRNNLNDLIRILKSLPSFAKSDFRIFAEISMPSILFEVPKLEGVAGFVVDYETLLKLIFYRESVRVVDHEVMLDVVRDICAIAKKKGFEVHLKLQNYTDVLLDELIELGEIGMIFSSIPEESTFERIKASEQRKIS